MSLTGFLVVSAIVIGVGIVARTLYDLADREGHADALFVLVLIGVTVCLLAVIGLVAVVAVHWPPLVSLVGLPALCGLGAAWRESLPAIGRALTAPRVLRPLAIGIVAIVAIWLFGASLPFRAVVLQIAFLAFVVWLLINLVRPFRSAKKKS